MTAELGDGFLALWGALGFDVELMARYGPRVLAGLWTTLALVALSFPLGFLLAVPLALARREGGRMAAGFARGFSAFFRGAPLLAQLFLVYYGAGQFRHELEAAGLWWLLRDPFWCAALAFTLNTAAYQSEILNGALAALPRGQREAADALGLTRFALYARVLLPQALGLSLRPLGNELILLIKGSAVAGVVTVSEIFSVTRYAFGRSADFEVYLWAAILYLILVEIVRRAVDAADRRRLRKLQPAG